MRQEEEINVKETGKLSEKKKSKKNAPVLVAGQEGHLSDLRVGQRCELIALHNDNLALRRRLLDMGLTKGVTVKVKKIAPLGDPIDIELRGYELCVRKSDLMNIDVKVVE